MHGFSCSNTNRNIQSQPSPQALSYKSSIEFPLLDKQRQYHNEILIQVGKRMKLMANAKPVSVFSTTL
jgi:hypothetical protein